MHKKHSKTGDPAVGSTRLVRLPNDTKIRFCNAMHALTQHTYVCTPCTLYTERGDGDLCEAGKYIIARELCYSETHVEFPPNESGQARREGERT
jgi:hypothetical protein